MAKQRPDTPAEPDSSAPAPRPRAGQAGEPARDGVHMGVRDGAHVGVHGGVFPPPEATDGKDARSYHREAGALIADLSTFLALANASVPGIAHIVLTYAKLLTGSTIGYVSTIDAQTGDNICHTLTDLFGTACRVTETNKSVIFPRAEDGAYPGLWGYSLNARKAMYANEPETHPSAMGLPIGHFELRNFLAAPVLFEGRLLGQIALANKPGGYDDRDLEAILRLAAIYAVAVERAAASPESSPPGRGAGGHGRPPRARPGSASLDEARTAMETLLRQKEQDHQEAERAILRNVKELISPYLDKLERTELNERQQTYVSIIKQNIDEILSPFLTRAKALDIYLTPQEMQIASLIRGGYQTKDIAELLSISTNSVSFHRKNIRIKLGIQNKKINLRTFLLSIAE